MENLSRRFRCVALLICLIGCFSLVGCEGVIVYGVGKSYLDKDRAPVYITENENEIIGCDFIKQVKASTTWGGFALQDEALQRVISDLTHESLEAGANVLLIRNKSKSFMGSSASGDAYRCKDVKNTPSATGK